MLLLNGKELSDKLYDKLSKNIVNEKLYHKLIILTIGDDAASKIYVRNKLKACERVGIKSEHIILNDNIDKEDFAIYLQDLLEVNVKNVVGNLGIILQLPAPKKYVDIFNSIVPPRFDVDGFGKCNKMMLFADNKPPFNYPATPKGIMTLLEHYNIDVQGKHVVIVGRSEIVGRPLAQMMLHKDATVTICHSKTQNLEKITKQADILVVAIGKPKFINSSHISEGVTIIDVGINRTEEGLCGDVDFEDCKDKCYAITPVPGGVGPMTVYSLMENIINIANNEDN